MSLILDERTGDSAEVAGRKLQTNDPATQTALTALLAKASADPATQTTLAAILAQLVTQLARLDLPTKHSPITPNDATDITAIASKGLQIGGSGNIYYTLVSDPDTEIGPVIVQPGQTLWGQFAKVKTKGGLTTATNIFGLS